MNMGVLTSDWLTLREKGTNSTINTKCTSSLGMKMLKLSFKANIIV